MPGTPEKLKRKEKVKMGPKGRPVATRFTLRTRAKKTIETTGPRERTPKSASVTRLGF